MLDHRIFYVIADQNSTSYLTHVQELESSTEPGSVIGMTGGGDMAYLIHDRTIINLDGLISSYAYFQALKNSRVTAYLEAIHLKYVFGRGTVFTQMDPYQVIFKGKLKNIARFDELGVFLYSNDPALK